jgi:hypothetical protein
VRLLTSAILSLLALTLGLADGFGRFGYRDRPNLPGFTLDLDGFSSKTPSADKIWFGSPARQWKPSFTNESGQVVSLNAQALGPQKARYSLWQSGFSLFFDKGVQFRVGSTGCPYLTWGEGTVGEGVPTPDTSWVLISFRTAQPPILLVLESGKASFQFAGKAGNWILKTEKPLQGWMRCIQPLGTAEIAANSAAALGQLNKRVFENISIWTQPAPQLLNLSVKGDATAVVATWTFDRPAAIVPLGAALADLGGYPVRIQSKIRRLSEWNDEGPIAVAEELVLKVRFPIRRIPLGRSITVGKREIALLGTVSPIDIPSVSELALENLLADRDMATFKAAEDTLGAYLTDAVYTAEPVTNQQMPFAVNGAGIDLAACHALLMQTTTISNQSSSESNSLMTSVSWRRDAYNWRVAIDDPVLARRAGALASLAGFLCPEPERRLQGAMFEAGLAAERGLGILRARRAGQAESQYLEPLDGLRRFAYYRDVRLADEDPFGKSLLSEVRVFGDSSVVLEKQGEALSIQWQAADTNAHQIVFASAYPIDFELGNLKKLEVERSLGLTQVRFVANAPGPCMANLRRPDWAKSLPAAVSVPRYSEPLK